MFAVCSHKYDTDLTDEQWKIVENYIPLPGFGGRPCTTDFRRVLDGIFYFVKAGCPWRLLPGDFPPWQTVHRYFLEWTRSGVWRKIHLALVKKARVLLGREEKPTAVVIDSQSVKTGKVVPIATRGYDGGKKVKGRKRHMATDTQGILLDVSVTPANVHDTKGALITLRKIARREGDNQIGIVFADKGYQGDILAKWVEENLGAEMQIGNNRTTPDGFVPDKKRWVVERSFSWIEDYNRLSKDRERLPSSSLAYVRIAFIRILLRRLTPTVREWKTA